MSKQKKLRQQQEQEEHQEEQPHKTDHKSSRSKDKKEEKDKDTSKDTKQKRVQQLFKQLEKKTKVVNRLISRRVGVRSQTTQLDMVQEFIKQQKVVLFGFECMDVLEAIECISGNLLKGLRKLRNSNQMLNEQKFHSVLSGLVTSNDKPIVKHLFRPPHDDTSGLVYSNLKVLGSPFYFYNRIVSFLRNENQIDELLLLPSLKPDQEFKLHNGIKVVFFILNKFVNDISNYLVENKNRDLSCIAGNIMNSKRQIAHVRKLFLTQKQHLIQQNSYIDFNRLGEIGAVQHQFSQAQYDRLQKLEKDLGQFSHIDNISLLIDQCFDRNNQLLLAQQEAFQQKEQFTPISHQTRPSYL